MGPAVPRAIGLLFRPFVPIGVGPIEPGPGARPTVRKDILPYYRALGLNPGAGPAEIRRAWRQMVQQWHPDLYKPGSLMQKTAEDITKEVNEAYGQLYRKKLYRQYPPREEREGEPGAVAAPPEAAAPSQAPEPRTAPPPPGRPNKAARTTRHSAASGGYAQWEERLLRGLRARRTKVVLGAVLALAAIPLCWAIWESVPSFAMSVRLPPAAAPAASSRAAVAAAAPAAATCEDRAAEPAAAPAIAVAARDPDLPYRGFTTEPSFRALVVSTPSLLLPEATVPAADPDPLAGTATLISELFEMGDTKAKVLAVEGSPDDAGDTVYRYGSSLVYFRDGRVRGWVDRLPRLRVRSWASIAAPSIERFSLGSSRGEVERAQGAPGAFTADTYLFGSSAVYFANGRVSGWSEGGVPLHALQLRPLPFRGPEPAPRP